MVAGIGPSAVVSVFVGGVGGTLARYGAEYALPHRSPGWPSATFAVNVAGAFLLGLLLASLARRGPENAERQRIRLLVGTGFFGAFTTYSTLALESVVLADDGHVPLALAYALVSVVAGAVAAWAGTTLGSRRWPR